MASQKTLDDIAELDIEISELRATLKQMRTIKRQEEGSQGSRFSTDFQNVKDIKNDLYELKATRARLMMVV